MKKFVSFWSKDEIKLMVFFVVLVTQGFDGGAIEHLMTFVVNPFIIQKIYVAEMS